MDHGTHEEHERQLQIALNNTRRTNAELLKILRAVVDNRDLCFIPEEDCPTELQEWTIRAHAAIAHALE